MSDEEKINMAIGAFVPYTHGIARVFTKYMEHSISPNAYNGRFFELNNQGHKL